MYHYLMSAFGLHLICHLINFQTCHMINTQFNIWSWFQLFYMVVLFQNECILIQDNFISKIWPKTAFEEVSYLDENKPDHFSWLT